MKRVLVTGMSGTGKSTLLFELADRGHWTVDTDYGGYFEMVDGERLWIEDRMGELLSVEDSRVCCSSRGPRAIRWRSTPGSTTSYS